VTTEIQCLGNNSVVALKKLFSIATTTPPPPTIFTPVRVDPVFLEPLVWFALQQYAVEYEREIRRSFEKKTKAPSSFSFSISLD
jgi:hypothetical protein